MGLILHGSDDPRAKIGLGRFSLLADGSALRALGAATQRSWESRIMRACTHIRAGQSRRGWVSHQSVKDHYSISLRPLQGALRCIAVHRAVHISAYLAC
jgi:hypothetical protein